MTSTDTAIVISQLYGEDRLRTLRKLHRVLATAQHRLQEGAVGRLPVVLVPSSAVLNLFSRGDEDVPSAIPMVEGLVRISCGARIDLTLIDDTPPLGPPSPRAGQPSLGTCGSPVIREYVIAEDMPHITWQHLSSSEMATWAEGQS